MVAPTLILGIGNILLRDEGIGVRVVEAMRGLPLPKDVEILDGGTSGLRLIDAIADRRKLIVIDAVMTEAPPAAVLRLTGEDLAARTGQTHSPHEFGLLETLTAARHLGVAPREVIIYGVQPKDVGQGLELSPEVAAVVPKIIELVLNEAHQLATDH
jgi:hydrogenase maturation protease